MSALLEYISVQNSVSTFLVVITAAAGLDMV